MTHARPAPDNFAAIAGTLTNKQLMERFGVVERVVTRWRVETSTPSQTRPGFDPLPLPDDWATVAPGKSQRELRAHYGRHSVTIKRWVEESGVKTNSRPNKGGERPRPDDFAERWAEMSQLELRVHFRCGKKPIDRWVAELGLSRAPRVRAVRRPGKVNAASVTSLSIAPVDRVQRDMSRAGQAADYLRRFGPVARCDERGRYDPNGTHWRRGSTVLDAEAVIERAIWNGWAPDAWRMVA